MTEEPDSLTGLNFVQVTARQTWSNLPLVIAGGFVFALACVPAALLGFLGFVPLMTVAIALLVSPAWTTLLDMLLCIASERPASLSRLPRIFLHYWMPSVRLSLLFVIPMLAGWMILPAFQRDQLPAVMWLALFADIVGLALAWSIGLYAFPLLIEHDQSVLVAIRNGTILSSRHVMNTVGLVSLAALGMVATGVVGIALLLFLPGLYGMFVVNNYRLVMSTQVDASAL